MRPADTAGRRGDDWPVGDALPRYRGSVRVDFPAALSLSGIEPSSTPGRPHGHDFTAIFLFESRSLVYPGVVVDDEVRAEISQHVTDQLAYRDLGQLLHDRPTTCEAIAEHLASWHQRSAWQPPRHARLISVAVTTGSGGHGEIRLPTHEQDGPTR